MKEVSYITDKKISIYFCLNQLFSAILSEVPVFPVDQTFEAIQDSQHWPAPDGKQGNAVEFVCLACSLPPDGCTQFGWRW